MSTPAWFDRDTYLQNKLIQLQQSDPAGAWTATKMYEAFSAAGFNTSRADDMFRHFQEYGNAENISPNGWFDVAWYKASKLAQMQRENSGYTAAQLEQAFADANLSYWDHYGAYGAAEGVDPSAYFSTAAYMQAKLQQMRVGDPAYTLTQLQDALRLAGLNPIEHYVLFGRYELLNYTPDPAPLPEIPDVTGQTFILTPSQDTFVGGDANDLFHAQAGTLQSRDLLDGGEGNDTLKAELSAANTDTPLNPTLRDVENLLFTVNSANGSADVSLENVSLTDGRQLIAGSVSGTGNLTLSSINHASTQTTLLFRDAMPGMTLNATFADTALKTEDISTGGSLVLRLVDTHGALSGQPLLQNPFTGVTFTHTDNGQAETVRLYFGTISGPNASYQNLLDAINGALSTFGYTDITATLGDTFRTTDSATGAAVSGREIILTAASGDIQGNTWLTAGGIPSGNTCWTEMESLAGEVYPGLISTSIALDGAGRMDWNALEDIPGNSQLFGGSAGPVSVAGMQKYNITVDQGSWVSRLEAGNASLYAVSVSNADLDGDGIIGSGDADKGNLILGDSAHYGMEDVRIFDASAMTGKAFVNASVTGQASLSETNAVRYSFGGNNDTLHLTLDGQTASAEDFSLKIDMGAGADTLLLTLTSAATATLGRALTGIENVRIAAPSGDAVTALSLTADTALQSLTAGDGVSLNLDASEAASLRQVVLSSSATEDTLTLGRNTSSTINLHNFSADDDTLNIAANAFAGVDLTSQKERFDNWDVLSGTGTTLLDNSICFLSGNDFSTLQIGSYGTAGTIGVAAGASAVLVLNEAANGGSLRFYVLNGDTYTTTAALSEADPVMTVTGVGSGALTDATVTINGV